MLCLAMSEFLWAVLFRHRLISSSLLITQSYSHKPSIEGFL